MRDPANWALPLVRLFGVRIRVHILYVIFLLVWCRFIQTLPAGTTLLELFYFVVLLPLPILFIHEIGHIATARILGGDADNITIWPLGGLTQPHTPSNLHSQIAVSLAGPVTSLLLCLVLTSASVGSGYVPMIGLTSDPIAAPCKHTTTNLIHTNENRPTFYRTVNPANPASAEKVGNPKFNEDGLALDPESGETLTKTTLPTSMVWLWRANWLSLWLVVCNLAIAALPFDVGRIVMAIASSRGDDPLKASISVARFAFLFYIPIFILVGIVVNETLLILLAVVILVTSARLVANSVQQSNDRDADQESFGYDFSQGYTSLEKSNREENDGESEEASDSSAKLGFWERRRRAKEAEKIRKEAEQDQRDAQRVDELLDKIQTHGQSSLTPDEKHFLERMSLRYRDHK